MKYGLIGERLEHSFSKKIHERLGYEYELREISPEGLDAFMRKKDFLGINVTMPYKAAVIPYLDEIDEAAREIGAVNTIVNRGGMLYGYNTDFYGLCALITRARINVCGKKAVILGTGGTSNTAAAVLKHLGAGKIIKVGRSKSDGNISYDDFWKNHLDARIIVNTTPVGMYPNLNGMPIDIYEVEGAEAVIDAVYNPLRTLAVQCGENMGAKARGGLYMLVAQAIRASEIFFDKSYPEQLTERIYREIKSEKENIVLIGMPSSGKSTVGRIIAERLGRRFVDTDELICERIGTSIAEFFSKQGEAEFRRIESQVIESLACENGIVISTGGGAVLDKRNIYNLKYNGTVFFIDRKLCDLIPTDDRPLSKDASAMERLYKERYSIYLDECDEPIKADGDAEYVAEKIMEFYR